MDIPIDGTYSVPVSGPSPHLAMLRSRHAQSRRHRPQRLGAAPAPPCGWPGRLPRSVAVTVSSLLATNTGYTALTGTVPHHPAHRLERHPRDRSRRREGRAGWLPDWSRSASGIVSRDRCGLDPAGY
ncbi:MAG: hypothetical protein V9G10_03665 [Candidatus Nanopelagicales bacterium]